MMDQAWTLKSDVHIALVGLLCTLSYLSYCSNHKICLKPWLGPSWARAKPRVAALAWPKHWESQSHLRPSQSRARQITSLNGDIHFIFICILCITDFKKKGNTFTLLICLSSLLVIHTYYDIPHFFRLTFLYFCLFSFTLTPFHLLSLVLRQCRHHQREGAGWNSEAWPPSHVILLIDSVNK